MVEEESREESQKDIKIGEIELREGAVLVVKKTSYKGQDRIDFRVWLNTPGYKGPTKQGFAIVMDKVDEFLKILEEMKKFGSTAVVANKLETTKEKKTTARKKKK
jgi:hypothetical protein